MVYYQNPMTFWHIIGLLVAFVGVSWYTMIKLDMKKRSHSENGPRSESEVDKMELGLKALN
jgi:hypothetical protein